jgi:trehalose/maltose hydrolase-like predicted phosphorylase
MSNWPWIYSGFEAECEGLRETLTTLGNGYFCTRGAAPWADADDAVHYPGTYAHGGYNRLTTEISGRPVENEDLVNLPNWLPLTFRIEDASCFDLDAVEVLTYRHELQIRVGELLHEIHVRDDAGRETLVAWRRLVSLDQPHLAAIQLNVRPVNWSGRITVCSALDGRVVNWGVKRYRELEHRHLIPLETGAHGDTLQLVVQTNQSGIAVGQAARTRVFRSGDERDVERRTVEEDGYVADHLAFEVEQGRAATVEKIVALYISKERSGVEPGVDAREAVAIAPDFEALALAHRDAWDRLWRRCDLVYTADENVQQILRLHTFHALQTTSPHTVDLDTSAPARGLHGEAYRGHIFWDELYIFPYFLYASGREETQTMHLNPKSGRWNPDTSHHQRHISLAVAFNTWEYVRVTDDRDFLATYGAEILVEIARFWASISHFDETRGRYEIHGVMGPDEFHEKYPGSDEPGLRNNAYTNIMVAWLMDTVAEALERLDAPCRTDLLEKLGVANEELALWSEMSGKLFVPFHGDGIISQFEGYEALKELDWNTYREKYDNIQRMDRILEAEGDSADEYQLSKQADVLMLFYLFPSDELKHLFGKLGYPFDSDTIQRNVEYYEARTSHGSTLSNLVHAAVTAGYAPDEAWRKYLAALESDVSDIQGGTTKEGIHLGVMAGTVDLLQRGFLGLDVTGDTLTFDPVLPARIAGLTYTLFFRGRSLDVTVSEGRLTLGVQPDAPTPLEVRVGTQTAALGPGDTRTFSFP